MFSHELNQKHLVLFHSKISYHRIIEWVGLEETSKIIQFQYQPLDQALDQVAQGSIQPGLELIPCCKKNPNYLTTKDMHFQYINTAVKI